VQQGAAQEEGGACPSPAPGPAGGPPVQPHPQPPAQGHAAPVAQGAMPPHMRLLQAQAQAAAAPVNPLAEAHHDLAAAGQPRVTPPTAAAG
jgi:hypothetical protein